MKNRTTLDKKKKFVVIQHKISESVSLCRHFSSIKSPWINFDEIVDFKLQEFDSSPSGLSKCKL